MCRYGTALYKVAQQDAKVFIYHPVFTLYESVVKILQVGFAGGLTCAVCMDFPHQRIQRSLAVLGQIGLHTVQIQRDLQITIHIFII